MQLKIDSYILDDLATSVVYADAQLGGGPDEESATRGLIETCLLILGDAIAAGWEPPVGVRATVMKMTDEEDDDEQAGT